MLIANWRDYALTTVRVHDLDPTYDFLYKARVIKGQDWADKFALHYLLFYDMGEAAKCAASCDQDTFWDYVKSGYADFRRGTERRHSRGDIGRTYISNLMSHGRPTDILLRMWSPNYTDFHSMMKRTFAGCGFGDYFIWKVMDFQDRILGRSITLNIREAIKYMPEEPRKCAKTLWPEERFENVLTSIVRAIRVLPAPGRPNRSCDLPEAETVLCMLKGFFLTQTHRVGDDVDTKYIQLRMFPDLIQYLPPKLNWTEYERPNPVDTATVSAGLA